jgi:hypothetical protein
MPKETATMPFKFDANGAIVLQEVNGQKLPVFVGADGKEAPFDGDATVSTISRLNGEAMGHRQRAEKAEAAVKAFEGITDPAAAIKALNTVKNLDDKKLVDAGEVERVKDEAIKSVKAQYEPIVQERDTLKADLFNEKIGGAFARSKFIADKVAMPADFVQAAFGKHFTVEGGKIVAKDANGQQMFSRTRHGEPPTSRNRWKFWWTATRRRHRSSRGRGHLVVAQEAAMALAGRKPWLALSSKRSTPPHALRR